MAESAARLGSTSLGAREDPVWVRVTLITLALLVLTILIVVPMINVFTEAFARGPAVYWENLTQNEDTLASILLTLKVAPIAVVLNVFFGVAAAWAIARFRFPGRAFLTSLIDLPFAVSPVVAGLMLVLIFGLQGYFGAWLREHDIKVIFALPGLILATAFVTFPFVARELIPLMEAIGSDEETAAVSLGARGWQIFRRVTLPNIKWGLLYGVILCNARAMGEFGAVYVVSGHIAGQTDTMPLRVEKLFQEYDTPGSFAVASLLSSLALITLAVKTFLEWQTRRELASRRREALGEVVEPSSAEREKVRNLAVGARSPRIVSRSEKSSSAAQSTSSEVHVGISIRNVTKKFGDFKALNDVSLDVPDGSLVALLGPSGSGKTTLLRIIAGLESPDEGSIRYAGEETTNRSPRDRNVGFVFQHYALFRHMSVFENVAFGLRVRKWKEEKIRERVNELLHLVQLENHGNQAPSQLSGGQRQRVALARALAAAPKVLLLDEPFGALDAKVRKELRQWLRKLHDEIHVTSVFVTHDQEEAFEVADRVVVMNRGRIEQVGNPNEVFEHPANPFVMDFLGNVNVFHGRVESGRAVVSGLELAGQDYPDDESKEVRAYVRPHELEVDRLPRGRSAVKGDVTRINAAGPVVKVEVFSEDFGVTVHVEISQERYAELELKSGEKVFVFPKRFRVFVQDFQI